MLAGDRWTKENAATLMQWAIDGPRITRPHPGSDWVVRLITWHVEPEKWGLQVP